MFPHLSVEGNLRYGARRAGPATPVILFDEVVSLLGLGALLQRRLQGLSGRVRGNGGSRSAGRFCPNRSCCSWTNPLDHSTSPGVRRYCRTWKHCAIGYRYRWSMSVTNSRGSAAPRDASGAARCGTGGCGRQGDANESAAGAACDRGRRARRLGARGHYQRLQRAGRSGRLRSAWAPCAWSLRGAVPGTRLRLQILARDVILSTREIAGLSVRNAVCGTIAAIFLQGRGGHGAGQCGHRRRDRPGAHYARSARSAGSSHRAADMGAREGGLHARPRISRAYASGTAFSLTIVSTS